MSTEPVPWQDAASPPVGSDESSRLVLFAPTELVTILFCGIALSVGWGVRGNWGHEFGAMIPGALAAMAAVLGLGREDWHRRIAYFAFFGAVGWSFGGSISYMWVIGYAHSGHAPSVLYGFASLFLIGFLWGALGGLGTALPACLDRAALAELLIPTCAVFVAWALQAVLMAIGQQEEAVLVEHYGQAAAQFLRGLNFDWYDTDWVAPISASIAVLVVMIVRRKLDWGSRFILAMAAGWWIGFTLLTAALGLRMTPNRSDNWSGMVGMVTAAFLFLLYSRMYAVAWGTLLVGLVGGLGFSGGVLIQLLELTSGYQTNWHSVLEQTYGFINGLGIGVAMVCLSRRTARVADEPPLRPWTETFCVVFVLLVITWLNIRKNVQHAWLENQAVPEEMYGLGIVTWFNLAYALLALAVLAPLAWHRHVRRLAILPAGWLGRAQLLFLVFLWWIVIGNLSRCLPFDPGRMITEGTIHVNACLLTLLALLLPTLVRTPVLRVSPDWQSALRRTALVGSAVCALVVLLEFGVTRAVWGEKHSGHGSVHIRFGPDATQGKYKP